MDFSFSFFSSSFFFSLSLIDFFCSCFFSYFFSAFLSSTKFLVSYFSDNDPYFFFSSDFKGRVSYPLTFKFSIVTFSVNSKSCSFISYSHISNVTSFSSWNFSSKPFLKATSCPLPVSVLLDHPPILPIM